MHFCASFGQGGPYGKMGWQLPTVAELTSLDGDEWLRQQEFSEYHLPPQQRSDAEFWTSSPWLGRPNTWATVQFSGKTTELTEAEPDAKHTVWCVRAIPARGLWTPG